MKLFVVGPYPPPHGGISVHVANQRRQARSQGVPCRVLNTDRAAVHSPEYMRATRASFFPVLVRHALAGWTIHVHANGHNTKSWMMAFAGGMAGMAGVGSRLTLHSGLLPDYLRSSQRRQKVAGLVCRLFTRIICVSPPIAEAVQRLGIPADRIEVAPAFTGLAPNVSGSISPQLEKWLSLHRPIIIATGNAERVYGLDLLIKAVSRLKMRLPNTACLLLGVSKTAVELIDSIERAGLARDVLALGDIPHDQCVSLISRANVFVRPTYADGDSISVREALALGVPVVASNAATRPDHAVLFETGNLDDLIGTLECVLQERLNACAQ